MAATREEKLKMLTEELSVEFRETLVDVLKEKEIISKSEFARMTGLLVDAFDELLAEVPNQKRMLRKLREYGMGISNIDYTSDIEDEMLKQATKVIREKIVRKGEREKLARLAAKEIIENWLTLDEDMVERIAGFDGLLESIQEKTEDKFEYDDSDFIEIMLELGAILSAKYMERLSDEQLDDLLERAVKVAKMIEEGEDLGEELLHLAQAALQNLGIVAMMRRAFAGLLLSDLIIRQIGKSLGIKEKISVTDFIIYVGVKILEKEELPNADKAQVARVRKILEKVVAL